MVLDIQRGEKYKKKRNQADVSFHFSGVFFPEWLGDLAPVNLLFRAFFPLFLFLFLLTFESQAKCSSQR